MSTSRFLDHVGVDMHAHRKKTGFFLDALDRHRGTRPRGDLRVLELGCGNGHVVSLPLAESGFDVTGVDFHAESIEAARAANPFPHARFVVGDVRDLEVGDGYDAVILSDVLEHVDDPAVLLATARHVLAPDGLLLVAIPNGYGPYEIEQWLHRRGLLTPLLLPLRALHRLGRRLAKRPQAPPDRTALPYNAESGHIQFFTRRRILGLLDAAGFNVAEARNGSLLGGELSCYAFHALPPLARVTHRAADRLPAAVVSTWYFACVTSGRLRPDASVVPAVGVSSYPVSQTFAHVARAALGRELEPLLVSSLRRLPPREILRTLRGFRGRPFALLLEDESSATLLPVMKVLALLAGASTTTVVQGGGTAERVTKSGALRAAADLGLATLALRRAAARAKEETAALGAAKRARTPLSSAPAVLYVNANLWFGVQAGGSVGHVAGVVNGLLDAGFEVDVAAVAPQPLVDPRAGFVRLATPRAFGLPPELNRFRFSQLAVEQLRRFADPARHRFVYQRLSLSDYTGAALAAATGLPLVLEYNGSEVWVARHWGRPLADEALASAAETASLRQARLIVTVSHVLGDELVARGVDRERLVVHPNGVDPDRFDPGQLDEAGQAVRRDLGIPTEGTVVTFLGTFGQWHGTEALARAIRVLAERDADWLERRDVNFLLVGDGLRMPAVRALLDGVLPGRVHLTGLVPQAAAPGYLAASDVVVSPHVPNEDGSPFFGSPTKLFEYMAMALPILASDLGQIGEVLQPSVRVSELDGASPHEAVALLAVPGDVDELAAGIRRLVDDAEWRRTLGENARRLVLERYTWRAHVAAILARLDEIGP